MPGCINIKRVPVLNRWDFEEFQECKADRNCEYEDHSEELNLGAIHIRVDVYQEHHVDQRDELGSKLY